MCMRVFVIIAALFFICISDVCCQTSFKLASRDGHYFITTTVNGVPDTEIFVESGCSALLMNKTDFEKLFATLNLEKVEIDANYKLLTDKASYEVVNACKGRVPIGGLLYDGLILVTAELENIAVPVHLLKNDTDRSATLIQLDFKKKILCFVCRSDVDVDRLNSYRIVRYAPCPIFEAKLELSDTYGHHGDIVGSWILDLGCGSPVFFLRKNIAPFIKDNRFKVLPSKDKSGSIIGQGLFAQYCKIGEQKVTGISIGITNRTWEKFELGCVGPSFFSKGYIVFDPECNLIYYK